MCYGNFLVNCYFAKQLYWLFSIDRLQPVKENSPEDPGSRTITLGKFQCYATCKASQLMRMKQELSPFSTLLRHLASMWKEGLRLPSKRKKVGKEDRGEKT